MSLRKRTPKLTQNISQSVSQIKKIENELKYEKKKPK